MAQITKQDGSRWYTWPAPDGSGTERYMSVTTIIDLGIPKPALTRWAAKETAIAAVEKTKSVFAILNDFGEGLEGDELAEAKAQQKEAAIDFLKGAPWKKSKEASLRGSKIHEGIEAYKLGRPYPEAPRAVLAWWEAFLRMLEKEAPIFQQTEARVYNRPRRYAGTLDSIGVWPSMAEARWPEKHPQAGELCFPEPWKDERGPLLVNDYKTGKGPRKGGVWPEAALQQAAYRRSTFIAGPEGAEWPMPETDGAIAIHLQPGWYELVPLDTSEAIFRHFLHAYETAIFQEEVSKYAVGTPIAEVFEESKLEEAKPKEEKPPAKKKPAAKAKEEAKAS